MWGRIWRMSSLVFRPFPQVSDSWNFLAVVAALLGVPSIAGVVMSSLVGRLPGIAGGLAALLAFLLVLTSLAAYRLLIRVEGYEARKLAIVSGEGPPFEQVNLLINHQLVNVLFRIGIKNLGGQTLENVKVALVAVDPDPPPFLPIALCQTHDRKPYKDSFVLNPGPPQHIDVAYASRLDPTQDWCFQLCYTLGDIPAVWRPGTYTLAITASARDTAPETRTFVLSVSGSRPTFREVEPSPVGVTAPQSIPDRAGSQPR